MSGKSTDLKEIRKHLNQNDDVAAAVNIGTILQTTISDKVSTSSSLWRN
jgi:hypothetical protein